MAMYKLTFPCELIDVNGNIVNTERTVAFDNKEELLAYVSGDTDGDINTDIDSNTITRYPFITQDPIMFAQRFFEDNAKYKTCKICAQIIDYMTFPSTEKAEKLYTILQENFRTLTFLSDIYYAMMDEDVDGEYPWVEEYCNKFIGKLRQNIKALAIVMTCAANTVIDAWKK